MIDIRITGYNKHTAGPLRTYEFSVNPMVTTTGKEDQFAYGVQAARHIILGLQAMEPRTTFEIREVQADGHGGDTLVDGVSLFELQSRLEHEEEARRREHEAEVTGGDA